MSRLAGRRGRRIRAVQAAGLFTIKQVGDACGLPGPVIMQLVERTWVDDARWMYTGEQLRAAVAVAENLRRCRITNDPLPHDDPAPYFRM